MTAKTDEQERADFEAWQEEKTLSHHHSTRMSALDAWEAWQARAALQSQDRDDAERYRTLVASGKFVPATLSTSCLWGLRTGGTKATKAELEREPVAWIVRHPRFCGKLTDDKETAEYWESKEQGCTAPLFLHSQPAPDVALVEALEAALMVMTSKEVRLEKQADAITMVRSQLAAHRRQGGK